MQSNENENWENGNLFSMLCEVCSWCGRIQSKTVLHFLINIFKEVSWNWVRSSFNSNHRAIPKVSCKQAWINSCRPAVKEHRNIYKNLKIIDATNCKCEKTWWKNKEMTLHENHFQLFPWLIGAFFNKSLKNNQQEVTLKGANQD